MEEDRKDYIYNYFLDDKKYGVEVAISYLQYKIDNSIELISNLPLKERMDYMKGFCDVSGLEHPDVFFEIEDYKEKKIRGELIRGAAVRIITRGENVCMPQNFRKSIEDKLKNE